MMASTFQCKRRMCAYRRPQVLRVIEDIRRISALHCFQENIFKRVAPEV